MANLPLTFTEYTRQLMGDERFERYLKSFEEEPPVSIRLNPRKVGSSNKVVSNLVPRTSYLEKKSTSYLENGEPVPWCRNAYYLPQRPNFTMDPLFHAGCYYVQEAASMFLDEVIRQIRNEELGIRNDDYQTSPEANPRQSNHNSSFLIPHFSFLISHLANALDLCAAPGGKSTLLRSALPDDCVLYSNEPIRQRANILLENVTKWGYPNHIVTNNYPEVFRKSKQRFDLILCDVPCSGEGMFRKDEATIREWSPQNVERCWQLQRDIVSDAWACLAPGGLLIYSTCTFNTKENEENVRWFLETFDDAEILPVDVRPEWNITGSLLPGFDAPVYRFIPGITRSEGLFMCVMRKIGERDIRGTRDIRDTRCEVRGTRLPSSAVLSANKLFSYLAPRTSHLDNSELPCADLTYPQALAYLRGEALVLPPDTPRGLVTVTFMGHPLGQVKNIGTRANNLYPKEWRIKTTHVPTDYEPVLTL